MTINHLSPFGGGKPLFQRATSSNDSQLEMKRAPLKTPNRDPTNLHAWSPHRSLSPREIDLRIRSSHVSGPRVRPPTRCEPIHTTQTGRFRDALSRKRFGKRRVHIGRRAATRSNRGAKSRRRFSLRRADSRRPLSSGTGPENSPNSGEQPGFSLRGRFLFLRLPFRGHLPTLHSTMPIPLRSHPSDTGNLRRRRFHQRSFRFTDGSGPLRRKQPSVSRFAVPAVLRIDETRLLSLRQAENRSLGLQVPREPLRAGVGARVQIRIQVRRTDASFA